MIVALTVAVASCARTPTPIVFPQVAIEDPSFAPAMEAYTTGPVRWARIKARGRGVQVVLLLPGAIDHEIVEAASRAGFGRLLDAGVEIYEYQSGLLHAKTMTIDGVWAMVGSANMDNRSLALNNEISLVAYDRDVAGRLQNIFEEDRSHAKPVDRRSWRARSVWKRFWEFLSVPIQGQL